MIYYILLFIIYCLPPSYYIQKNTDDPRLVNYIQKCTSKDLKYNRSFVELEQRNYGNIYYVLQPESFCIIIFHHLLPTKL